MIRKEQWRAQKKDGGPYSRRRLRYDAEIVMISARSQDNCHEGKIGKQDEETVAAHEPRYLHLFICVIGTSHPKLGPDPVRTLLLCGGHGVVARLSLEDSQRPRQTISSPCDKPPLGIPHGKLKQYEDQQLVYPLPPIRVSIGPLVFPIKHAMIGRTETEETEDPVEK